MTIRKPNHITILGLLLLTLILSACRNDIVYSRFYPMKANEWALDSIVRFEFPIDDTAADYSRIIYIRHTERYPYQNMWLFVEDSLQRDTIEFYLADERGQWLGNHHSGFIEMPVLLDERYHFADSGMHWLNIQQGMRDSVLRGITDVGVEIIRNSSDQ